MNSYKLVLGNANCFDPFNIKILIKHIKTNFI